MELKQIRIDSINPAPYNPRKDLSPEEPEYQKLLRSIEEFSCVEPVVWNQRSGNLVGGHQRLKVLIARGDTEVYVSVVDLPPEQEKTLNIALNQIRGDWDDEKLATLLEELTKTPEIDVTITGFDPPEIEELIARVLEPGSSDDDDSFDLERALDTDRPAVTQAGELIDLGRHRLLCGDSINAADVRRLMRGERAILNSTDPPYLVGYDGTNHPARRGGPDKNKNWSDTYGITWDDADAHPFLYEDFYRVAVAEAIRPDAAWYCWHASRRQAMVESVWKRFGAFVHQQII